MSVRVGSDGFGRLGRDVEHDDTLLTVVGHRIAVTAERDPAALARGELGVDLVIVATGRIRTREGAGLHLNAGARKALLSVPGEGADATIVMGVNAGTYGRGNDHAAEERAAGVRRAHRLPGRRGRPRLLRVRRPADAGARRTGRGAAGTTMSGATPAGSSISPSTSPPVCRGADRPGAPASRSIPVTVRCRGRGRNGPSPQSCPRAHRAAFRNPPHP